MPTKPLTLENIATLTALSAERPAAELYAAIEKLSKSACSWRLMTILRYDEASQSVIRLHSSDPKAYPVGGAKPLDKIKDTQAAMDGGEVFLAATKEAVRKAYFDHDLIFSLGITAILNAPVRHAGRRLGTLNLCGEEGMYGAAEITSARILAGLLVPALLVAR